MKMPVLIASTVLLTVAGCGSGGKGDAKPSGRPTPKGSVSASSCVPSDDSCIPPDHPSTSAIAVPPAKVGVPFPVQLSSSDGVVNAEVTITGMPVKPRTSVDKKGTKEFCFAFKLKNTGTSPFGDAGFGWKWFGLDGEEVDDLDAGTAGICDELGHEFAGLDQPKPLPGKFVAGYYNFLIPPKPGAVEITDSTDDTPLFRLDYGPQSAQVPIDARGQ